MRTVQFKAKIDMVVQIPDGAIGDDIEELIYKQVLRALRSVTNPQREDMGIVQVITPYGICVETK